MTATTPTRRLFVETVTERFAGEILASDIRPATQADIEAAQALHAQGQCPHNVVFDEAGWMYDFRSCHICGAGLGTV